MGTLALAKKMCYIKLEILVLIGCCYQVASKQFRWVFAHNWRISQLPLKHFMVPCTFQSFFVCHPTLWGLKSWAYWSLDIAGAGGAASVLRFSGPGIQAHWGRPGKSGGYSSRFLNFIWNIFPEPFWFFFRFAFLAILSVSYCIFLGHIGFCAYEFLASLALCVVISLLSYNAL